MSNTRPKVQPARVGKNTTLRIGWGGEREKKKKICPGQFQQNKSSAEADEWVKCSQRSFPTFSFSMAAVCPEVR